MLRQVQNDTLPPELLESATNHPTVELYMNWKFGGLGLPDGGIYALPNVMAQGLITLLNNSGG